MASKQRLEVNGPYIMECTDLFICCRPLENSRGEIRHGKAGTRCGPMYFNVAYVVSFAYVCIHSPVHLVHVARTTSCVSALSHCGYCAPRLNIKFLGNEPCGGLVLGRVFFGRLDFVLEGWH